MTDKGGRSRADALLFRNEETAKHRLDAHHGKEIGRDLGHPNTIRRIPDHERGLTRTHARHALKRSHLRAHVCEIGIGELQLAAARICLPNAHDLIRIRIRQRTQQHAIHHAEDRGARADSERQCEHRNSREHRALGQHAKAVTEVLSQIFNQGESPRFDSIVMMRSKAFMVLAFTGTREISGGDRNVRLLTRLTQILWLAFSRSRTIQGG